MRNIVKLAMLAFLALFCMGASTCKKKGPSEDETTQLGGEKPLFPPGSPGGNEGEINPEVPGDLLDPDDGVLVGRGDNFGNPGRELFEPVYFGFDRSTLSGQERTKVERVADYLQNNTQAIVRVEGHCDWQGTTEYNLALGERRASAVKQFLIALGINAQRISVSSQGDLLAVENGGNSNMAKDRKARFILDKG